MLFRLRCHFCGTRSKNSRGTTEFQCQSCEAWNFFDKTGEVTDAPARVAAAPTSQPVPVTPSRTFAQPAKSRNFSPQEQSQTFCQACLTNQRIYTESLANYLPDDDHPQYYEYERNLPEYKADLERRYPQICKKCAPKAQTTISKADRYGLQQNVAKNMRDTYSRKGRTNKGQRDDWSKWSKRVLLHTFGWAIYASLLVQAAWHAYSLFITIFNSQEVMSTEADSLELDELAFELTLSDCASQSLRLSFHKPCVSLLSSMVGKALLVSLALIWYSPGLALWHHHTIRVEAVHGRKQHFVMQVIILAVRTLAWLNLTNTATTADLTKSQVLAAHGFMIGFMLVVQKYSERAIRCDRWTMKGKMMRGPDEVDVFGAFAGPEKDDSPAQASSIPPVRLFERNDKPFPIESLAPRNTRSNASRPYGPPPSPPDSQSVSDEEMEDQMDWQPSHINSAKQAQYPGARNNATYNPRTTRSNNNYNYGMAPQSTGWGSMRNELSGIQSQQTALEQQRREAAEAARQREIEKQNRSPFRGTLPPDPMKRHLSRNILQKKEQPLTERNDFYEQMSKSFGSERFGAKTKTPQKIGGLDRKAGTGTAKKNVRFNDDGLGMGMGGMGMGLSLNDDDEDFSPVKSRVTRSSSNRQGTPHPKSGTGSLNFREGQWRLPVKAEDATGLEDLFSGAFRIADEPATVDRRARSGANGVGGWPWGKILLVGVPVAVLAIGWTNVPIRRAVCLWLVEKLENMGV